MPLEALTATDLGMAFKAETPALERRKVSHLLSCLRIRTVGLMIVSGSGVVFCLKGCHKPYMRFLRRLELKVKCSSKPNREWYSEKVIVPSRQDSIAEILDKSLAFAIHPKPSCEAMPVPFHCRCWPHCLFSAVAMRSPSSSISSSHTRYANAERRAPTVTMTGSSQ